MKVKRLKKIWKKEKIEESWKTSKVFKQKMTK